MNPYAPPKAELADPEDVESSESGTPIHVKRAVWLLAGSLALGAIKTSLAPVHGSLWVVVATIAIVAGLTAAISRGVNWARVTFLVLFLLGLPGMFFIRELLLRESRVSLVILAAQTVFQLTAAALLFLPASTAWFRNRGRSNKPAAP